MTDSELRKADKLSRFSQRDIRSLTGMVDGGKTFSMSVPDGTVEDFVQHIADQLAQAEAPTPIVLSLSSPTVESDIEAVTEKAMHSRGFPGEFREQNPEYYIWVNPDHIVERGFAQSLMRVSKYARNIFMFDHPYDFSTIPPSVQYALGAETFMNINFDK